MFVGCLMTEEPGLMLIQVAAARIGVPREWLKREAIEGRIPCLVAGRRILVDFEQVKRLLAERVKVKNAE